MLQYFKKKIKNIATNIYLFFYICFYSKSIIKFIKRL